MKRSTLGFLTLGCTGIILSSCSSPIVPNPNSGTGSVTNSSSATVPTRNVSYIGTIDVLESSIYLQGTHILRLNDGQFILLESTDSNLNLNVYLGKRAEVQGSVQPTVEGNSTIMRVEEVTVLDVLTDHSSSSVSMTSSETAAFCGGIAGIACQQGYACVDNPEDSCDPEQGGADCGGICVVFADSDSSSSLSSVASSSSKPTSLSSSSSVRSSTPPSSSSASVVSSSSAAASSGVSEDHIVLMAKQNYIDALWTQKYCTVHIGMCVPAHKNWYFTSFGATTTNIWHVEFGMNTIDQLYQGPIVLNVVSGTTASMNATDGQIRVQGSDVVGFRDWNNGTHIEIIADARLREAVAFMTSHITSYVTGD